MTKLRRQNIRSWERRALVVAVALSVALGSHLVIAYTPEQIDLSGVATPVKWPGGSVIWSLNPTTGSNVAAGSDVRTALGNAFNTWKNALINGQSVSQLTITQGANTALTNTDPASASDCVNIVSFVDTTTSDFPTGTIAFAALAIVSTGTYSCTGGPAKTCSLPTCIVDADIMFNPAQNFSTALSTPSGSFDVQAVATHEIGHMLGLDHSGIAHAVMYPFGDVCPAGETCFQPRTLALDDAAGIGFLYPTTAFTTTTGTISGKITLGGNGIFASHVLAIDASSGDVVLDGLTGQDGTYNLVGLPMGTYNVLALPLAPDTNSGIYTLTDFSGWSCGYAGPQGNAPPCCDPKMSTTCTGTPLSNPTNYTGRFF